MSIIKPVLAGFIILIAIVGVMLWIRGRPPSRPRILSASAIYLERGITPFKLSSTPGDWLDCRFNKQARSAYCLLTDEKGNEEFEDTFLSYPNATSSTQTEFNFDPRKTGTVWIGSSQNHARIPVVFLTNGVTLLPQSEYQRGAVVLGGR